MGTGSLLGLVGKSVSKLTKSIKMKLIPECQPIIQKTLPFLSVLSLSFKENFLKRSPMLGMTLESFSRVRLLISLASLK